MSNVGRQPPIISVSPLARSRREIIIGTPDFATAHIVLAAGVLGTALGDEVLRRAGDPSGRTAMESRGKRSRRVTG